MTKSRNWQCEILKKMSKLNILPHQMPKLHTLPCQMSKLHTLLYQMSKLHTLQYQNLCLNYVGLFYSITNARIIMIPTFSIKLNLSIKNISLR